MVKIGAAATLVLALTALAACGKPASTAAPAKPAAPKLLEPKLKPGLWESRIPLPPEIAHFTKDGAMVVRTCYDEALARETSIVRGAPVSPEDGDCVQTHARQADGGWASTTTCRKDGHVKITETVIRGDLSRAYTGETVERYEGAPPPGQEAVTKTVAQVTRLGDCPPKFKAGDVQFNDAPITSRAEMERQTKELSADIKAWNDAN